MGMSMDEMRILLSQQANATWSDFQFMPMTVPAIADGEVMMEVEDDADPELRAEIERARAREAEHRAERERIAALPVTITMTLENTHDQRPFYRVLVKRGEQVIDEYSERREEQALALYNRVVQDYEADVTLRAFSRMENGDRALDLRGEVLVRRQARGRIRIDRRARRPEEDVVREDDLVLNIPLDIPEEPVMAGLPADEIPF